MTRNDISVRLPLLQQDKLARIRQVSHWVREGGPRIKHEVINNKHFFHNYGLGAAAVPLSFGAATMSAKGYTIFFDPTSDLGNCAVIGAGILGIMTALELNKRGRKVTVYSSELPELQARDNGGVDSQVLPVVWLPNDYDWSEDMLMHQLISKLSFDYFRDCVELTRYQSVRETTVVDVANDEDELREVVSSYVCNMVQPARIIYQNSSAEEGSVYKTFHIQSPLFLEELKIEAMLRGIRFVKQKFTTIQEILALPQQAIWNCTNASSQKLFEEVNLRQRHYVLLEFQETQPQMPAGDLVFKGKQGQKQFEVQCIAGKTTVILKAEGPLKSEEVLERLRGVRNILDSKSLKPKL